MICKTNIKRRIVYMFSEERPNLLISGLALPNVMMLVGVVSSLMTSVLVKW